jgi:hypothetical protein
MPFWRGRMSKAEAELITPESFREILGNRKNWQ